MGTVIGIKNVQIDRAECRVPTRCPRCGNSLSLTRGPYLRFGCGTKYRRDEVTGRLGIVDRCSSTWPAKANVNPGPDADPVHGERPERPGHDGRDDYEPEPPRAARVVLCGTIAGLRRLQAALGGDFKIAAFAVGPVGN